ncbi:MAG: HRDC domain-containing protein [Candidatus Latescibacterota bacterium]|nr:HRDC domain-containing protein [Candidatus Latescibacterota bacterium]
MIESIDELSTVCREAEDAGLVGLDTEFVWERTYYPQLGVVQLSIDQDRCYLVDTVALDGFEPLGVIRGNDQVVKILHDAPQDLTILKRLTGVSPRNVFDTRVAAGFLGYRASLSLQDLTKYLLNLLLDKTETRTDWLKRPLSDKQLEYALDDVRWLPAIREKMLERANRNGRYAWMQQELLELNDPATYEARDPETQYVRVKGAGRVSDQNHGTLQAVTAWREREAEHRDLPRRHVVGDDVLVALAKGRPSTLRKLRQIRSIPPSAIDRYGQALIEAIAEGNNRNPKPLSKPGQFSPKEDVRVEFGLAFVRGRAIDEGIDPALTGSRNDVRDAVINGESGESGRLMAGWRREFVGDDLQKVLLGEYALRIGGNYGLPRVSES